VEIAQHPMFLSPRPFLRWWWFSGVLAPAEIDEQLDWVADRGFGGVEVAWVYPLPDADPDGGMRFLDQDWQGLVLYTIEACRSRGLGCDLTFGTLWPFGGTFVPPERSARTLDGYSGQRLTRSWESRYHREDGCIVDHLDRTALNFYAAHLLGNGFAGFAQKMPMAFFCDSWEVETDRLSYRGLERDFADRFGYDLQPYTKEATLPEDVRFDYRALLSDRILTDFYSPYAELCRQAGAVSRVQCHGAPTDVLAAYALVDIPETETLLFDPSFALLAASAAAIAGKPLVTSESFSCIYGWVPKPETPPGLGLERIDDLRCVADAQFAWGVNRVIMHGKPYSTLEHPNRFYATVHLGSDGALNEALPSFNRYLDRVGSVMGRGSTCSRLAVLFPLEDQWMRDQLPPELEKPSSRHHWELQEVRMPDELMPWRPLWISGSWLSDFQYRNGKIHYGNKTFDALLCDVQWLRIEHLDRLRELGAMGAPIIWKRLPAEPGRVKHPRYEAILKAIGDVDKTSLETIQPLFSSDRPLDFWCRTEGETYYLFISHPGMRNLRYPLPIGYAEQLGRECVSAVFHAPRRDYVLDLTFDPARSLLCRLRDAEGIGEFLDLDDR